MTFPKLLSDIQQIKSEEKREQTDEYLEMVIAKETLAALHKILTAYFGPPLKPEGQRSSGEAKRRAKPYGGIRKDQTMYFRQTGEHSECVLLWPWGNGARVTIKVIQSQNADSEAGLLGFLATLISRK